MLLTMFFASLFVNIEQAEVSGLGEVLESADIPSAAESLHVGGDTASDAWASLREDCRETEREKGE